jgi:hypothetical protein
LTVITQQIALDTRARGQTQFWSTPNLFVVEICSCASSAVTGHGCFTTVRIKNTHLKIRIRVFPAAHHCDTIRARTEVAIANAPGKLAQLGRLGQAGELSRLNHDVVVAETVKLNEPGRHFCLVD